MNDPLEPGDHATQDPDELLLAAAWHGSPDAARAAIARGADVNLTWDRSRLQPGWTPLFCVLMRADVEEIRPGLVEVAQVLLGAGADPDIVCHPYKGTDLTARQQAQAEDQEIFALIEQRDFAGLVSAPSRSSRRSIDD